MAEKYTVVDFRKRDDGDARGNSVFYVDAEGPTGVTVENAYYATKNKPPVIGQTFDWDFENGEYGPRFRNPSQQQGSSGGGSQGGAQRRSGGAAMTPDREAKIVRQHSQEMALRWAAQFPADIGVGPDGRGASLDRLTAIIDWFDEDAMGATPPTTAATGPSLDETKKKFQDALKANGLSTEDALAAINAMYGRDKLEATDDVAALITKAKELTDEVPF